MVQCREGPGRRVSILCVRFRHLLDVGVDFVLGVWRELVLGGSAP